MTNNFIKYLFIGFFVVMLNFAFVLLLECRFFYAQSQKMLELQKQYRSYINSVQKVLRKYSPSQLNGETSQMQSFSTGNGDFPDGVQVFSSDDNDRIMNDTFMPVNREPAYLKDSMIAYLKDQKLEPLLKHINIHEWQDYTNQLLDSSYTDRVLQRPDNRSRSPSSVSKHKPPTRQPAYQAGYFSWPIEPLNFWLSSLFGPRKKTNGSWGVHNGIDMAAMKGTPVKATASGVVIEARYAPGYGNTIVIAHNYKYKTRCAHLHAIKVKVGQKVSRGSVIGTVGETGFIRKTGKDGSHLHFEVYQFNKRINPLKVLPSYSFS